jgi:hypothetical protein
VLGQVAKVVTAESRVLILGESGPEKIDRSRTSPVIEAHPIAVYPGEFCIDSQP